MAECNDDSLLANILSDCSAVKRIGGVKAKMYYTRAESIEGIAVDATTGNLKTLVLKTGAKFLTLEGRKFKNTAGTTFARSENGPNLRNQSVMFRAYIKTAKQRDAVDAILDNEGFVFFVPTNGGVVKVYGYSKEGAEISQGLSATDASESDGTAMGDDTTLPITFTGAETNLPLIYEETGGFSATLDYLDTLVTA